MGRKGNKSPKRTHSQTGMDHDQNQPEHHKRNKSKLEETNHDIKSNHANSKSIMNKRKKGEGKVKSMMNNRNRKKLVWVDKCGSNKPPKDLQKYAGIIRVEVTGVDLSDDHTHRGLKSGAEGGCTGEKIESANVSCVKNVAVAIKETKEEKSTHNHSEGNIEKNGIETKHQISREFSSVEEKPQSSQEMDKKSLVPFVHILRSKSALIKKNFKRKESAIDLPNGDCGDGVTNPFPKEEVDDKYWAQRKRFFSKFDNGIQLDKESWYSVTPEAIANHVAKRMVEDINESNNGSGAIIVDAFCGCGGNSIGLARRKSTEIKLVLCIDIDRSKLKMAANNASIYGVEPSKMLFIEADSTMILQKYYKDGILLHVDSDYNENEKVETETFKGFKIGGVSILPSHLDAVFMSPPWGGMNYLSTGKLGYLLKSISLKSADGISIDGEDLLFMARNACRLKYVAYFLPRNINGHIAAKAAFKAGYRDIEVEKNVLNGKLKTVTIYLKN